MAGTPLAEAFVRIRPDTSGFERETRQGVAKAGKGAAAEGAKYGRLVGLGFTKAMAGAFAGLQVAQLLKSSISAASDLNETMSKTRVVFGPASKSIEDFGRTAATSLGLSRQEALEAASTLGNLFVSMKIGQRPAADMSRNMVKLAGDLASFNNASPKETMEALRAGLVGETEPLRKFGINLNESALKAEAMRLGLGKIGPTLTAQQRTQAAYSLIMKQSTTAQGDFARTSGGLANQQRIASAQFKDAQAALGNVLLPTMVKVMGFITHTAIPALQGMASFISKNKNVIVPLVTVLGAAFVAVKAITLATKAYAATQAALNVILSLNPVGLVIIAIAALVAGIVIAYKRSETFRRIVDALWRALKDGALTAISFVLSMIQKFLTGIGLIVGALAHLPGKLGAPFRAGRDAINAAKDAVGALQKKIDAAHGKTVDVTVRMRATIASGSAQVSAGYYSPFGPRRAMGGQLRGPGGPTGDRIPLWGSDKEWVVRAGASEHLGQRVMRIINQADRLGLDGAGLLKALGYARGGMVDIKSWIHAQDRDRYVYGATGPNAWDCSSLTGGVWALLHGKNPNARYFTTASDFRRLGFLPGYGGYTIGVRPGVHMAGNYLGLPFEAANPRAGIRVGTGASPVSSFPRQYHLAGVAALSAADVARVMRDIAPKISKNIAHDLGFRKADMGAVLHPGPNLLYNDTGRPEPLVPAGRGTTVESGAVQFNNCSFGGGRGDVEAEVDRAFGKLLREIRTGGRR